MVLTRTIRVLVKKTWALSGTFLRQGTKMREWPKSLLGFFRGVYCGESSPKFQMYNEHKDNGALTK